MNNDPNVVVVELEDAANVIAGLQAAGVRFNAEQKGTKMYIYVYGA